MALDFIAVDTFQDDGCEQSDACPETFTYESENEPASDSASAGVIYGEIWVLPYETMATFLGEATPYMRSASHNTPSATLLHTQALGNSTIIHATFDMFFSNCAIPWNEAFDSNMVEGKVRLELFNRSTQTTLKAYNLKREDCRYRLVEEGEVRYVDRNGADKPVYELWWGADDSPSGKLGREDVLEARVWVDDAQVNAQILVDKVTLVSDKSYD